MDAMVLQEFDRRSNILLKEILPIWQVKKAFGAIPEASRVKEQALMSQLRKLAQEYDQAGGE
jgi:hypothetical protein